MGTSTLPRKLTSTTAASTTKSTNVDSWWISTTTFTSRAIYAVVVDKDEPRDSDAASGDGDKTPEYAESKADDYPEYQLEDQFFAEVELRGAGKLGQSAPQTPNAMPVKETV